jgi:pimeloyl-ACP methyl ester carboxylesterase
MNEKHLQQRCTMYSFDLPRHGRSDLGSKQQIGNLKCDEETYVGTIKQVIQNLKLQRPIVCGVSMAGQVCLAVALRASELGVSGVIPC